MLIVNKLFKQYDDTMYIYNHNSNLLYYVNPTGEFDWLMKRWFKKGYNDKNQVIYEVTPDAIKGQYITTYTHDEYGEISSWNSSDGTWAKYEHNCAGSVIYEEYSGVGVILDERDKC